jgi:hypothetical protein
MELNENFKINKCDRCPSTVSNFTKYVFKNGYHSIYLKLCKCCSILYIKSLHHIEISEKEYKQWKTFNLLK